MMLFNVHEVSTNENWVKWIEMEYNFKQYVKYFENCS